MMRALQEALFERNKEWDSYQILDLAFYAVELGGETGEAMNVVKKLLRERAGVRGSRATEADLKDELEDVIICACLVANAAGIVLDPKDKFNATSIKNNLPHRL